MREPSYSISFALDSGDLFIHIPQAVIACKGAMQDLFELIARIDLK
jgi:hypothetical protein